MAVYLWSTLPNGELIEQFNPLADELRFDDPGIAAAFVEASVPRSSVSLFRFGGKTVAVHIAPGKLTSSNVTFADGSVFVYGDNSTGVSGDALANTLTGSAGSDQLLGAGGNDTLDGGPGQDLLRGGAGTDSLAGGAGNDTLDGGGEADTLAGGAGNDTLIYDAADTSVRGGADTDTLRIEGSGVLLDLKQIDDGLITDIEIIDLTGAGDNVLQAVPSDVLALSSTTDTLQIDGNFGDAVRIGGGWTRGSIQVIGANAYETYTQGTATLLVDKDISAYLGLTILGTSGADLIVGTALGDIIFGLEGDDTLSGAAGDDLIVGGAGADSLAGGEGDDILVYDPVDAVVQGGTGLDTLRVSGFLDLSTTTTQFSDIEVIDLTRGVLEVSPSAVVALSSATDTLRVEGGSRSHVYTGAGWIQGRDQIIGDELFHSYTQGGAVLLVHDDVIVYSGLFLIGADTGEATLSGGELGDVLAGGNATETLVGNGGNDRLDGGGGPDRLFGGGGNDTLVYDAADVSVQGGPGVDTLLVEGAGVVVDLTRVKDTLLQDIEVIDITGTGPNVLQAALSDVLALSSATDVLRVEGDPDDIVVTSGWTQGADTTIGLKTYHTYTQGPATLLVQSETFFVQSDFFFGEDNFNDSLSGKASDDNLYGLGGNDSLDGASGRDTLRGGSGNDVYYVDNANDVVVETSNTPVAAISLLAEFPLAALEGITDTVVAAVTYSLQNVAYVENLTLAASTTATAGTGNELDNVLTGNELNNTLTGGAGSDTLDGGAGIDTAVFSSTRAAYAITRNADGTTTVADLTVVGALPGDGADTLSNVERLQFSDKKLAFDLGVGEAAGNTAKLLGAVFGSASVQNTAYVGIGLQLFDGGMSYAQVADLAIHAALGPSPSNADLVRLLYTNVVGSAPDEATTNSFVALITSGQFTQDSLTTFAADHVLNTTNINLVGLAQSGLEFV